MSFTGTQLLAAVRTVLDDQAISDTKPALTWADADLCTLANLALRRLRCDQPEAYLDDTGARVAHVDVTISNLGNTIPVPDQYMPVLVDLVAGLAFMEDGGDKDDRERSQIHASRAASALGPHTGYTG